ncbi:Myosin light chain kinase, smooth muscle [Galemys pyrenaicus]|uniref:Myosin light chain kinase, smooth muscle n=1 Tax=Galemys pyrenaicus TaxID=202257 RepID=A0A8J5ZW15_GALPY|nr:Myosin light chain kinase, smooth muscle [Galemys pyrenaicus]
MELLSLRKVKYQGFHQTLFAPALFWLELMESEALPGGSQRLRSWNNCLGGCCQPWPTIQIVMACVLSHWVCLPGSAAQSVKPCKTMGDVKLVASTHISKTSLSVDHSRVSSMSLTEAPAFILPPRNLRIKEGGTAKFEGRLVTSHADFS